MKFLGISLVLFCALPMVTVEAAGGFVFLQFATTTKRGGFFDQIPAIVGIPNPPAAVKEDDQFRQTEYLEKLYQQRLKEKPKQAGDAVQVTQTGPEPPSGTAPGKAKPQASKSSSEEPKSVELEFTNVPIDSVINSIMRELGYSYVIDPSVSGSVNLFTSGTGIPQDRLFEVLEQILKMNGHAIIRQDDLYVIVPINQSPKIPHRILVKPEDPPPAAKKKEEPEPEKEESAEPPQNGEGEAASSGPTVLTVPPSQQVSQIGEEQGVITYVIPLHYIPSGDMVKMTTPFVSDGATVIDFASANMILITDYRKNIRQVLNLVNILDTRYFDLNTVDLITIQYNQAKDVAEDLAKIFAPGDKAGGVRIVAIERLNSILVVTHAPSVLREVKGWIDKLDTTSTSTNVKTFVYQVENNTAMNIADVLAQLYEDGVGLPSGGTGESEKTETRPQTRDPGFMSPFQRGAGTRSQLGPSLAGRPMTQQSGIRAVVSGNVKIIVNEFNNSLIVQATEADYQFLLQTIKQLDVLPRQVMLEARIYSVELRDELSFGVAAFLRDRSATDTGTGGDGTNGTTSTPSTITHPTSGSITAPSQSSKGGALSFITRTFLGFERQLEGAINALRSRTNVELLENPRLLATDGMQASINVGAEVPVTTSSFGDPLRSGAAGAFVNSIQFRPTGTTLLIMPRISASGIVTMDLAIEVSSAVGAALTPTINRNYVETSLIVRDGQTVAIAGIISDQLDRDRSRVPILGDIPILGALFGQTTRNSRRSELVFFITPHVIRSLPTATELTLDFKRSLRSAYSFIEDRESKQKQLIEERREKELLEELRREPEPQP